MIVAVDAVSPTSTDDETFDLQAVEEHHHAPTGWCPVYLAGLPVDMDRLYAIARRHGLRVIDAAQAIGSRWNEKLIGSFGDLVSSASANEKSPCAKAAAGARLVGSPAREQLRLQGVVRSGLDIDIVVPGGESNLTRT